MRPGQKNRMRGGRNNSPGRRGPNPLTRSFESNGPDVKVRGTPQHIAEKYVQLARDAHSAGDTVMTESYLQHAEHYYRIIAAAHSVQQAAYNQANGLPNAASEEVDDEDEFEVAGSDRFTFRAPQAFQPNGQAGYVQQGFQPAQGQPYGDVPGIGDQPPLVADGQGEGGQGGFQPRPPRPERPFDNRRPFEERGDRPAGDRGPRDRQGRRFGRDRNFADRPFADRANGEQRPAEERLPERAQERGQERNQDRSPERGQERGYERSQERGPERAAESAAPLHDEPGLPSFITAPVRPVADEPIAPAIVGDEEGVRPRARRRRRPRVEGAPEAAGGEE